MLAVFEASGLRMRYGPADVLHGVDLAAHKGEVVALLGPNGAGKTTTIEILEGLRSRTGGDVSVLGADPAEGDEAWRARLGVVLQSWRDHAKWRVRELLAHLGRYYRPYREPYDAGDLLALVGLTDKARARIATLSGGQRRRLDVAVGLVGRPELLFLDEPTTGFDPQARQEFHDLVRHLKSAEDTTILLTTHDLDEAEKLSDRIVILMGGAVVADGTPASLAELVAQQAEVRWTDGGVARSASVEDATAFARSLFEDRGDAIADLEIRRPRLEDVYLSLVRDFESGRRTTAPGTLLEVGA